MTLPSQNSKKLWAVLLHELDAVGGQAAPKDIYDRLYKYFPELSNHDLELEYPGGGNKWTKLIRWARQHLANRGLIDESQIRGVWKISENGQEWLKKHWRGAEADYSQVQYPSWSRTVAATVNSVWTAKSENQVDDRRVGTPTAGRERPTSWERTVQRALAVLDGEASEIDILRWVQDNRSHLPRGWQRNVRSALREHGDGRGRGLFESVPDRAGVWMAVQSRPGPRPRLPQTPNNEPLQHLGRLLSSELHAPDAGRLSALEQYLLGVMAYELQWYPESVRLLDRALENRLSGEYRQKAETLRNICYMKSEG